VRTKNKFGGIIISEYHCIMDKVITLPDAIIPAMKKEAVDMDVPFKKYIEHLVIVGRQTVLQDLKAAKKKPKK
jgi:hypothetical protein